MPLDYIMILNNFPINKLIKGIIFVLTTFIKSFLIFLHFLYNHYSISACKCVIQYFTTFTFKSHHSKFFLIAHYFSLLIP